MGQVEPKPKYKMRLDESGREQGVLKSGQVGVTVLDRARQDALLTASAPHGPVY